MSITLALDFGNSRLKTGIFQQGHLTLEFACNYQEWPTAWAERVKNLIPVAEIKYTGISCVGMVSFEEAQSVVNLFSPQATVLPLTSSTPMPFTIAYRTPHTLGPDRMALAAGAAALAKGAPILAVSAGTALTTEFLSEGRYLGGRIAPGLTMRLRALHEHTSKLPAVSPDGDVPVIGYDTETSLRSGALRGMAAEIDAQFAEACASFGSGTRCFLTGGDAPRLVNLIKSPIFADSALVLKGIYSIVQHHFPDA